MCATFHENCILNIPCWQYLAGLFAEENLVTKEELQDWVEKAYWYMLYEYTIPWLVGQVLSLSSSS